MRNFPWFLLILAAAVYVTGLQVDVMEIDAAQYASISHEMLRTHGFLEVKDRGADYLDKPPLLFWLSSLSLWLLGASNVAYKLPSLLFTLLAAFSTLRIGMLLFSKRVGLLAAAMLVTCEAFIFINNDVRTDTILAGAVIFAVWQLTAFVNQRRPRNLLLGSVGIALAMLAKGPIGVMVPLLALASYLAWRREWRVLMSPWWLAGAAIVALMLSPMLWGLYHQFGARGLRFYFWTQSFGRITGESRWHDNSGYFFFLHTFLWAFLPWCVLAYFGMIRSGIVLWRSRGRRELGSEALLLGGIVLPFVALSCSRYKLPHYIFVFFPLVAILCAKTYYDLIDIGKAGKGFARLLWVQRVFCVLLWVFVFVVLVVFFPTSNLIVWSSAGVLCAATAVYLVNGRTPRDQFIIPSMIAILGVNLILNIHLFPSLLSFQAGSTAARIIAAEPGVPVYGYLMRSQSLDFYTHRTVPNIGTVEQLRDSVGRGAAWVLTTPEGLAAIGGLGNGPTRVYQLATFHITKVTMPFLNHATRKSRLGKMYLLRLH